MTADGHKMRKKRLILTTLIGVVITAIVIVGIFLIWEQTDINDIFTRILDTNFYSEEKTFSSDVNVKISIKGMSVTIYEERILSDHFRYFYSSLGELSEKKMTDLYTFQTEYELFDKMALEHEINCAKNGTFDLSFDKAEINIYVTDREESKRNENVKIDLKLSASVKYKGLSQPVSIKNELHSFVLDESGKDPLIKLHETNRPSYKAAMLAIDDELALHRMTRKDLTYTYYYKYIENVSEELLSSEKKYLSPDDSIESVNAEAEYEYDRMTAALSAVNGFESDGAFTEYEENDANYISRCIFSGGIPMDSQGERGGQWKWYDEQVNYERKKTGCTESWFVRNRFFDYAVNNTGFGMVSYEVSPEKGGIGDVVQVMHENDAVLEFMITGILYDDSGKVCDYLVSNDVYSGASLKTTGFAHIRVLHIVGYNTANI